MSRLAVSVAALTLLTASPGSADMAAGVLTCSRTEGEITWQGSSPADLLELGSRCGSSTSACLTSPNDFLALAERKKCRGTRSGPEVVFVCTGSLNQVKKAIDDLCKSLFP